MPTESCIVARLYPWPESWYRDTNRLGRDFLDYTFISVALVAIGALLISVGTAGWMFLFLGLATGSAALHFHRLSRSDLRQKVGGVIAKEDRLEVRSNRTNKFLVQIGNAAFLIAATFALLVPFSITLGNERWEQRFLAATLLSPLIIAWMTARLLSRPLFRKGSQMGIALSEYGVHHTSWWGESRYPWSSIDKIRIHRGITRSAFTHRPKEGNHLVITLDLTADGKSQIKGGVLSSPIRQWGPVMQNLTTINAAALDVYPPVTARVLTFYFEHPELRGELGTEKALERVRTGNFVA